MDSFYEFIKTNPSTIRLKVNELLLAEYQCPLSDTRYDIWSHHNYFIYVVSGKKKWFTHDQEALVQQGDCLFVKKGAHSVFQYFDNEFCAVVLFVPDEFIRSVLLDYQIDVVFRPAEKGTLFPLSTDSFLPAYFQSFLYCLKGKGNSTEKLLELKFRELVMFSAAQPKNSGLSNYFANLCKTGKPNLMEIMEDNFHYPLSLEEYAQLSSRSLSAFKSDFKKVFGTTPGRWLKNKRLLYSKYLLKHTDKQIAEIVHDSGFLNDSHFSREFKTAFNCTPGAFRSALSA